MPDRLCWIGKVRIEYEASAPVAFRLLTDQPGDAMAQRHAATIPAGTRRTYTLRVPGTTRARLVQPYFTPSGTLRIEKLEMWAKVVGVPGSPAWQWVPMPVPPTAQDWAASPLPIEPTPDSWSALKLPIDPTPDDFVWVEIPMDRVAT